MNRIVLKNVFADLFIRKENANKIFEIVRFWGELFVLGLCDGGVFKAQMFN